MSHSARLCVVSSRGEIVFTSQGWQEFVLKSSSAYAPLLKSGLDFHLLEDMPPTDPVALIQVAVHSILKGEKEDFNFEFSERTASGKRWWRIEVTPLSAPNDGCQILVDDISQRKSTDTDWVLFSRLEKLISETSYRLIRATSASLDQKIIQALREVGILEGVDYSFVVRLSEDRKFASMTHYWHSQDPEGFQNVFQRVPFELNPFRERILANETFFISDLNDIPPQYAEYRKRCEALELKTMIGVPIVVDDGVEGYVGLVMTKQYREWTKRESMILRVLSEIFGTAFQRMKIEDAFREREKSILTFYRNTTDPSWCFEYIQPVPIHLPIEKQIELFSLRRVVECNDAGAKILGFSSRDELLGRQLPNSQAKVGQSSWDLIREYVANGYRIVNGRVEESFSDGTRRVLLHQAQGVVKDGYLIRSWGSCKDITDQADLGAETTLNSQTSTGAQYRNSSLTAAEIQEYMERVEQVMKNERPYRDSIFSLPRLAKLVRLPDYQVSQVLSMGMKTSFYDLVNSYRVSDLIELLSSPEYDSISILDLAYRVGFNSKSSFNTAFKKITGVTPSQFRLEKQNVRVAKS